MKPVYGDGKTHMVVAGIVTQLVNQFEEQRQNDPTRHRGLSQLTKFHSRKAPGVSISDYMERIQKHTRCSEPCYLTALIYIDRVIQKNQYFSLSRFNVHRYDILLRECVDC